MVTVAFIYGTTDDQKRNSPLPRPMVGRTDRRSGQILREPGPSTPNVPVAVTVAKPARGDHRLSAVGRAAVVIARVDVATAAPTGTIPGASCSVTRRGPVTNFLPDRVGLGPVSISHVSASARSSLVVNLQ